MAVRVAHGAPELPALPQRAPLPINVDEEPVRANLPQRPPRAAAPRRAAEIERIGHVVLGTSRFRPALADDSQRAAIPNLLRTYTIAWDLT